jgi:diguanylate cyclase (GGDEF)-like protein/PAS domain S-box-containing protein
MAVGELLEVPRPADAGRAWLVLVVLGAVAAACLGIVESTGVRVAALAAVDLISIGAVLTGLRRHRPEHPGMWLVLAVGMFVLGLGSMLANLSLTTSRTTSVALFQGSQSIGYPLLFLALLYAARTRRETNEIDSLLDGMILGTAFGFLVWRSLLSRAVDHAQTQPFQLLVATFVPALDIVIVVGLLRRMLSAARTPDSLRLLLLAVVATAMNHVVSGLAVLNASGLARHIPIQSLSFTLLGAAALHPSMGAITRPDSMGLRRFGPTRIGILALALLITPGVILLDRNGSGQVDTTMLIGASGISMIVMIRLISLAREAEHANQRERTRERRFESLVRNSSDLIAVLDPQHRLTYVSPAVTSMLGFTPDDALGVSVLALFHHDDRETTAQALDELGEGETSELRLVRLRHREGSWRWVEVLAVNLTGEAGIAGTVVNCRDVTERVAAEKLLLDTGAQQSAVAQLGRDALSASDVPSILTSTAALIRSTLEAGSCQLLRLDGASITAAFEARHGPASPVAEEDLPSRAVVAACLDADDPIQFADLRPDRSLHTLDELDPVPIDITRIGTDHQLDEGAGTFGGVLAVRVVDRDTTVGAILVRSGSSRRFTAGEASFLDTMARTLGLAIGRRSAEAAAQHQALHDSLTTLPNRALFVDRLTHALALMERAEHSVAVLFLDLDHFKVINDSLGHSAGDRILTEVAHRLLDLLRPGDTVARFGGDEFTVLLDGLDHPDDARRIAERIRLEVGRAIHFGGAQLQPSVSIGIAVATAFTSNAETLLRDADAAMYRAKERGRDKAVLFDDTMRDRAISRLRTEIDLRRALARGELVLHYQPVVDLTNGHVNGVEALVRWEHPREGLILPDQFIPVAEQTGLIGELGTWVMTETMRQCAASASRLGAETPLFSLNLSARTLADPDLCGEVELALQETGAPAGRICLEITESALMDDIEHSLGVLRRLHELGVKLAIDDFGTGYSSLTYVKQLPVDVLKIDRSFVAGLGRKTEDSAIVAAVVRLAATLHQTAVAEGVETGEQLDELRRLDCPMAQGFLLGRPAPVDELVLPGRLDIDALTLTTSARQ